MLEDKNLVIKEEVNASKDTLKGEAIWELVKNSEKVVCTSGKKILEFDPLKDKQEMLEKISGRTGNLRAPVLKCDSVFYVGYNEELYQNGISQLI